MSFFLIFEDHGLPRGLDAFLVAAATHGFKEDRRLTVGTWQIVVCRDQSQSNVAFHRASNGDFILALGSLLFEARPAPDCLALLLERFRAESFAWRGLVGTHVLLIKQGDSLHVCTDGLGATKIYCDGCNSIWTNSFLAILAITKPKFFDAQACYQYVINGAVFGNRSLVQDICSLPNNSLLTLDEQGTTVRQRPCPIENVPPEEPATLDGIAACHIQQLDRVIEPLARHQGDRIRLSFSGGFDSRLMLAMLIKHGAKPTLFVYGGENDEDVRIARVISKAEGLSLECIDKSATPAPDLDGFIEETEKNLFAFDGWKVEAPLFDFGQDRKDRLKRHIDGQVPLNGSLGEIYRNFFYMPDRTSSTKAVVSTFYSPYDPRSFTDRFNEQGYRSAMALAMREAIGAESDELERSQVEELYPKFRGRFWTGRDAQINQRFGPMFFPYLEPAAISNTAKIPIKFKDLGYLQGRMIAHVNPRLAGYPSDYGFALDGPRPLSYRLKTFLSTQRPAALRRLSFRLKYRAPQPLHKPLTPPYLSRVIDLEFPIMRELFNIERVHSTNQYGLIATLEYLGQRYNLRMPDD